MNMEKVNYLSNHSDHKVRCFIRLNTPGIRKRLENLGYGPTCGILSEDCIEINCLHKDGATCLNTSELHCIKDEAIDCGKNKNLFFALASLRKDTDENQWFVLDANVSIASENFKPKGTFIRCNRKSWFRDMDKNGKPDLFSSRNIPAHKATVKELIKYFKDK